MCHVSCKRGHDQLDIKATGAVKVLVVVLETVDFLVKKSISIENASYFYFHYCFDNYIQQHVFCASSMQFKNLRPPQKYISRAIWGYCLKLFFCSAI